MITSLILAVFVGFVASRECNLPPSAWCSSHETAQLCQSCHFFSVAMITSLILAVFVSFVASRECNLPPSAWCSSHETAQLCQVKDECKKYLYPAASAPKVNISLHYESLCPYSINFIIGPALKAYNDVGSIMNLNLYPFGNADIEINADGSISYICQHGPLECEGNIFETCALNLLPKSQGFVYVSCVSQQIKANHAPSEAFQICGKKINIDIKKILECSRSSKGMELQKAVAMETNNLQPPNTYVPWVVVNGVHTEELQNEAYDLNALVCKTYTGSDKPEACKPSHSVTFDSKN